MQCMECTVQSTGYLKDPEDNFGLNCLETCSKPPCGVTNTQLELKSRKPYQKDEELTSIFRWKPDTTRMYHRLVYCVNIGSEKVFWENLLNYLYVSIYCGHPS